MTTTPVRTPVTEGSALRHLSVVAREVVADGVVRFTLAAADGAQLPDWEPGAHLEIRVAPGLVKHYSLCGDPAQKSRYEIAVLLEPAGRGGSRHLHEQIAVGDVLEVSDPRNHFRLTPASRYLFIAGGIGVTPLLPMVAAAEAGGAQWSLIYGGRSRTSMAFLDRLESFTDRVTVWPADERGLIDLAAAVDALELPAQVYCCGPLPLLRAVQEVCADREGLSVRFELFAAATEAAREDDVAFEVELVESGRTVQVPAGVSILEAVEAAGIEVPSSCGAGTCGTCETVVRAGVPDHRDSVLSPEERLEGRYLMICVSRAKSERLVLER